jgi:DNA-binding NtrC family response regulator
MNNKILVVDDDPDLRECLAESLELQGYAVCSAASVKEAVERLDFADDVRLIISDHVMRDGSGMELLIHVRSLREKQIPFILITGQSHLTSSEAFQLGAQEFIIKPFDFILLLTKIEHHLGEPAPHRAV